MLLAIDTATRRSGVALYNAEGIHSEISWYSHANQTVELMSQIERVMTLAHVTTNDLDAIGVALGPGSFTGLRVGMSVAKGFAFARKIPILGIPTLDAIVSAHSMQSLPMIAILTAGRGRYSVAKYSARDGRTERVGEYALVQVDGLIEFARATRESRSLFYGEIDAAVREKIAKNFGERAVIASPAMNSNRAAFLAELAWTRFARGESDDLASLAPLYAPHESVPA